MVSKIKKNTSQLYLKFGMLVFGFIFSCSAFCDTATDPLATVIRPQVTALFGPHSTVAYFIYLAELGLGAIGFAKTKNPVLFLGVPLLVLITSGLFTYVSGL